MGLKGRREKDDERFFEGVKVVAMEVALVVVAMAAVVVVVEEREKSLDMVVDAVKAMVVVEWRERD